MLDRLGTFLVEITDERGGRFALITVIAVLAGLFELAVHEIIDHFAPGYLLSRALDSLTMASLIAVISWIEVQAVQQRRRKVLEDLRIIRELNHNVRNALQVIQYASRVPEAEKQVRFIDQSVERIDATLKDLFPTIDKP